MLAQVYILAGLWPAGPTPQMQAQNEEFLASDRLWVDNVPADLLLGCAVCSASLVIL